MILTPIHVFAVLLHEILLLGLSFFGRILKILLQFGNFALQVLHCLSLLFQLLLNFNDSGLKDQVVSLQGLHLLLKLPLFFLHPVGGD